MKRGQLAIQGCQKYLGNRKHWPSVCRSPLWTESADYPYRFWLLCCANVTWVQAWIQAQVQVISWHIYFPFCGYIWKTLKRQGNLKICAPCPPPFCSAHSPVCDLVPNVTIWSMELPYTNKFSFFLPLASPFAENSSETSFQVCYIFAAHKARNLTDTSNLLDNP